ncbi:Cu+-exporting ATPase [Aquabacterium commune]|uniref:P-type Cu(+) transporter n=2 Tax=Aquabacterium commune TaxID=70586 RepID=A0A4R6RN38_9BURK|nr:Cu+-exporting ATPase [Aquabacterium commune]
MCILTLPAMNTTLTPPSSAPHDDPALLLAVRGMTCAACVNRVERALRKVPGVAQAQVNFATETASVVLAPTAGEAPVPDAARLIAAIEAAGYHAQLQEADHPLADEHASWWSVWGAVCLGALASVPLVLPMLWGDHHFWPAWVQFALATPVQFGLGARFYRAGWAALRDGSGNMDQLVALGTSAAWGLSVWLWWQHGLAPASGAHSHTVGAMPEAMPPALYFESSAVVITLVLLGKALEARAKRQTTLAIRSLQSLRPDTVRRLGPQGEVEVPLAQVLVGDVLVVLPGARVPSDGLVQEGSSHVDESLLTGEPLPVAKHVGDRLTGGAINAEGRLLMQVTAVGGQTMLAHIIRRVVEAQASKAPIQRVVDRVSAVFVPTVLVIALLTGVGGWLAGQGADVALIRAVAVLVIACPCALGLATPAAIMAGTGAAARQGILIQDPQALEVAHRVQLVAFDKTGTLTQGQPRLLDWAVASATAATGLGREQALQFAAALQRGSEHPLALAVLAAADTLPAEPLRVSQSRAVPGRGIEGVVSVGGSGAVPAAWAGSWCLGSPRWMQELTGQGAPADVAEAAARWSADGATVSWLLHAPAALHSDDGEEADRVGDGSEPKGARTWQVVAALAFGDALKPGAAQAVARLHALGVRTAIISGDSHQAAQAIARQVGIQEVIAEVLPGDKADHIRRLQRDAQGRAVTVAMVGDGLNDAPALAAADIGMAMANPQGGTDVAMQAAGITLMRGDPLLVPAALEVSRRTSRKIWQNLGWAFGYNVIGIPLAALGGLNPMLAGAAMALSSVSVVSNALWLSRWRPQAPERSI